MEHQNPIEPKPIDSYIRTASITLVVGMVIFLDSFTTSTLAFRALATISMIFLTLTFLSLLWFDHRFSKRTKLFKKKLKKIREKNFEKIKFYMSDTALPLAYLEGKNFVWENRELLIKDKNEYEKESEKSSKEYVKKAVGQHKDVIDSFLENMRGDLKKAYNETYFSTLNERKSKTLFLIDQFSRIARYHLFTIGIISFLLSIIFKAFIK